MLVEQKEILEKIKILRLSKDLSQYDIAEKMNLTQSSYARFESGKSKTDLETLIVFCKIIEMTLKEFFIYPDSVSNGPNEEVKAIIQIELKKDKKDQVLKLIFGENNLEILNK